MDIQGLENWYLNTKAKDEVLLFAGKDWGLLVVKRKQ
jgi:hypothetical protein